MTIFMFDLDGTVTAEETLPLIANKFNVLPQIDELTKKTVCGNFPFIASFVKRVEILGQFPVDQIADLLATVKLHTQLVKFIRNNSDNCLIVTGNLEPWICKLADKVGCKVRASHGQVEDNKISKIIDVIRKESVVLEYQKRGEKVVFVGDSNNDAEAMRAADVSIACGMTHWPTKSVLEIADYLVFEESELCRLLFQLS